MKPEASANIELGLWLVGSRRPSTRSWRSAAVRASWTGMAAPRVPTAPRCRALRSTSSSPDGRW
jgi:hypothetical protein